MTRFDLRRQDCVKGMSRLGDESVDLVVTSPPYNLGISYGKYSDRQDRESYLNWCGEWAKQIRRVLKSSGSFFLNIGAAPSNPMLPHEIVMALRGSFELQNTIHWIKSIAIESANGKTGVDPHLHPLPGQGEADAKRRVRVETNAITFGHFKPISSKRFSCSLLSSVTGASVDRNVRHVSDMSLLVGLNHATGLPFSAS